MTNDRLLIEITVPAPVDVVWRALREPDIVRRWFGWEYDGLTAEVQHIFEGQRGRRVAQRALVRQR